MKRLATLLVVVAVLASFVAACAAPAPEVVEKEITVEVTREVEVTSEPVASGPEGTVYGAEGTVFELEGYVYRTEVMTLPSARVNKDYRIYIAFPPSYDANASKTYPALYRLDGNWTFILATEFTKALNLAELVPELIIVGIGYETNDEDTVAYNRELDLMRRPESFLGFIQEELIPHIDANYKTDPSDRTIAGDSFAGSFVLYALLHAPETFHRYIAMSPALFWDDLVTFKYEEEFARDHSELPVKLFLSVGGLDEDKYPEARMVSNLEEFHANLESRNYAGLEMEMVIMEDETHGTMGTVGFFRGLRAVFQ